ncbi:Uncharacterized protein Adt_24714 [Abeliophyllum distichum]|uniref:Uncharacterized protein n=1 Tax=Abeliophyllum distichum TaxID=126358 RepID=A0ABD1SHM1_9LAMI
MDLQQFSENDGSGRNIYVRLAASAPQLSSNKKNKGVIIGAVVGSVAAVMVLLAWPPFFLRRRPKSSSTETTSLSGPSADMIAGMKNDLAEIQDNDEEDLDEEKDGIVGITEEIVDFVRKISTRTKALD